MPLFAVQAYNLYVKGAGPHHPQQKRGETSEKMKKLIKMLVVSISIPESSLIKPDLSHIG